LLYNEREVLVGSKACDEVFKEFHDSAMGGHSGVNKTQNAISKRYYWPSITADIKSWVNIMITTYYVESRQWYPLALVLLHSNLIRKP
jgi:hypothetical protein